MFCELYRTKFAFKRVVELAHRRINFAESSLGRTEDKFGKFRVSFYCYLKETFKLSILEP